METNNMMEELPPKEAVQIEKYRTFLMSSKRSQIKTFKTYSTSMGAQISKL